VKQRITENYIKIPMYARQKLQPFHLEYKARVDNMLGVLIHLENMASYVYTKKYKDPEAQCPQDLITYIDLIEP
jgi:hypothetical protein